MKTENEILQSNFIVQSDGKKIVFTKGTPIRCANKIVELLIDRTRIVLDYGNLETGESWNDTCDIMGRIGLSKGAYNLFYPLLIHNSQSLGGGAILTDHILSIKTSAGKKLIFKN
jgi:hypothetical protein